MLSVCRRSRVSQKLICGSPAREDLKSCLSRGSGRCLCPILNHKTVREKNRSRAPELLVPVLSRHRPHLSDCPTPARDVQEQPLADAEPEAGMGRFYTASSELLDPKWIVYEWPALGSRTIN